MMRESLFTGLQCTNCRMEFGKEERILRCTACGGGELEVVYDYDNAGDFFETMQRRTSLGSIWDFLPMLPITQRTAVVPRRRMDAPR